MNAASNSIAAQLFRSGATIESVMEQTGRARSTVTEYLSDFLRAEPQPSVDRWVSPVIYQRVAAAAAKVGTENLKPIFEALDGQVPYDDIRIVVTHLNTHGG